MRCPYCNKDTTKVTDSRLSLSGIRRRRECLQCKQRFTTYERVQTTHFVVKKRDGVIEDYSKQKLLESITKACTKRPISTKQIQRIVEIIEKKLSDTGKLEISSQYIGQSVMANLKDLDRVAYIRFASVYNDFQDINNFEEAITNLKETQKSKQLPLMQTLKSTSGKKKK